MRSLIPGFMLIVLLTGPSLAQEMPTPTPDKSTDPVFDPEQQTTWAVASSYRWGTIPFDTEDRVTTSFIPAYYYDNNKIFFLRGLEGGLTVWRPGQWEISALGRLRFYDLPRDSQFVLWNSVGLMGIQARYKTAGPWHLDLEIMSDLHGRELGNVRYGGTWKGRRLKLQAFLQAQYKTSAFNSHFYGLDQETVGAGVEIGAGGSLFYNLVSNLSLYARAEATFLDQPVRDVSFVNRDVKAEVYLGAAFTNDPGITAPPVRKARPYLRLAQGRVSTSSLADIISGNGLPDPDKNRMTSLFYGHPLSDRLLGVPIQVYLIGGAAYHWPVMKEGIIELIMGLKIYYTVPLPVRLRLGLADGWSWVSNIPFVENYELREKGYEPNRLLNFLDISVDLNLGDIFGGDTLDRTWFGYGIHHRSAAFGESEQFGYIKGGSNIQTFYLQYHY